MGKFSFPVPRRKKQPPKATASEPMSKAHRILGSTPLNIDAHKNWDGLDGPGVSVDVAETSPSSYGDSSWGATERRVGGTNVGSARAGAQGSEEQGRLPPQLQRNGKAMGHDDNASGTLRQRESSSTIKSWYDRSTQPLAISHQASSSSMSRGLSSKAQRMLDMDNSHANVKAKKKPIKLDLSLGRSRNGKTYDQHDAQGSQRGPDAVLRSPSIKSPGSPHSGRKGRRLQKRPTQESLQSKDLVDNYRPDTSGSARAKDSNSGLHNLYDHYEQMSLRQLMDMEFQPDDLLPEEGATGTRSMQSPPRGLHTQPEESNPEAEGTLEPTLEPTFEMMQPRPPPTARTETSAKSEQASSGDYAASISSRHTRTSRASKHTDRSMQSSDLQEKSVLLLSSDSEDDTYLEPRMHSPTSVSTWRPSVAEDELAPLEMFHSANLSSSGSAERHSRQSSRSSKRTSFAPTSAYRNPTVNSFINPASKSPSVESQAGVSFMNPCDSPLSPSRDSNLSCSTASTATTLQTRPSNEVQDTQAPAIVLDQCSSDSESDYGSEAGLETEDPQADTTVLQESTATSTDQPTPPLSPTSVDFYIRSAHSSIDGPGSHSRFMAVSRQEEMLLAALRQKRQNMREVPVAETEEQSTSPVEQTSSKRHESKTSEATITAALFDFNFPTPPRTDMKNKERNGPANSSISRDSTISNAGRNSSLAGPILSPAPTRPLPKKGILKNVSQEPPEQSHEHILLYLDRPGNPNMDEPEPSPDLSDFVEFDDQAPNGGSRMLDDFAPASRGRHSQNFANQHRLSAIKQPPPTRNHGMQQEPTRTARIAEEVEVDGGFESDHYDDDDDFFTPEDVPRADSPISPESFPAVPSARMTLNKLARLSAVGPGTLGAEPGWWGDSD